MMDIFDIYRPLVRHFRTKRMKEFARLFSINADTKIVDVGGYPYNWSLVDERPHVTILNISGDEYISGQFTMVRGDGRCLEYRDNNFDIAFSNSVIEHVGGWEEQVAFAREIRRVAFRYYVQTPNKYFLIEPHLVAPLIHLLPKKVMRMLVPYFSLWCWLERPSGEKVDEFLGSIRLLSEAEIRVLFPDAQIVKERFLGMTKSIIAVRV